MTDSPDLIISGNGSVAVSTDAMLADADRLRTLAVALPTVSMSLRHLASMVGPAEAAALGSWRVREADAAIGLAARQLDLAIEQCGRIANALDVAAVNYGIAEREGEARFIAVAEDLAARVGRFVGEAIERNRGLALLLAMLTFARLRDVFGETIAPGDVEIPAELNALLSDPRVVRLIRGLLMAGDDFAGGIVTIPPELLESTTDAGLGAVLLLGLGSMGGLFASTPVKTAPAGPAFRTTPATTVAELATRMPNAVDGEKPQVRIEKYTAEGQPDRFEVYIGGTVDFSPVVKTEPFDLTSNIEMEAGLPAGSHAGVLEAMALAGIGADSPIVIAGHSQGGLIGSVIAASGDFNVEALVTFGAPAGQVAIPSSVSTFIVENLDDVVPSLGGRQDNRDALIVQAEAFPGRDGLPPGVPLPAHHIEAYIETAEAIDNDAESSEVATFRRQLAGLTSGYGSGTARKYLVTRVTDEQ